MFFSGHGGYSPGQLGGGNRSPVSSPTPQGTPALSTPSHMVGGYPGGGLGPGTNSHNTSGTVVCLLSISCLSCTAFINRHPPYPRPPSWPAIISAGTWSQASIIIPHFEQGFHMKGRIYGFHRGPTQRDRLHPL